MPKTRILGPKSGYDLTADYYASHEKYWDSFEQYKVLPMLGDLRGKKVLDVGAGTGRLALRMAKTGAGVMALDVSEVMIDKLKVACLRLDSAGTTARRGKLEMVIGDAESLSFENNSFDIVVAAFLIVHLKDPYIFFDEAYQVLKDGGILLVTNINQRRAPSIKTKSGLIEIKSYYHRPEEVVKSLEKLAFSVEENVFVRNENNWINQIIKARK